MNERRAELIYGQVLQRMDMTRETGDEELQELIRMTLEEASEKEYLPLNEKIELSRNYFMHSESWISFRNYWKIRKLQKLW